jgi:hypothetical protein
MYRALTTALLLLAPAGAASAQEIGRDQNGRAAAIISDGDMVATGYIDGKLGPKRPDLLSIIGLGDGASRPMPLGQIPVSNSVAGWPRNLATTPDGRFAIVTEVFGQRREADTDYASIPSGRLIQVIDIRNRLAPKLVQTVEVDGGPGAVDIHPGGQIVAVTLPAKGQMALYPFRDGRLGEPSVIGLGEIGVEQRGAQEFSWHPSGDFAAVTLGNANRVAFYRLTRAGENPRLELWGPPLETAALPGRGRWTRNGRFYIVTQIGITSDTVQVGYAQTASLLGVFAFDADTQPNSPPRRANDRKAAYQSAPVQHAHVAQLPAGLGYVENFAISPDERWLVGLNMVASWLPEGHPGRSVDSKLELFRLDAERGALTHVSTTSFAGVLPQGIAFEPSGQGLVVTTYQGKDVERGGGTLHAFRLQQGEQPQLIKDETRSADIPRGAHTIELLP